MNFRNAVLKSPNLSKTFCQGLQALERVHREQTTCENTRRLSGSVNIDAALKHVAPQDNRWDYAIGFRCRGSSEQVYWVEFHPATHGEIKSVMAKAIWLNGWLKKDGKLLAKFSNRRLWVSTGKTRLSLGGYQLKQLAEIGVSHIGRSLKIPLSKPSRA